MKSVTAHQNETVDQIAARCYGGDTSMTAAILDANPGLAAMGPHLPIGTTVYLPPARTAAPAKRLSLWD